MSLLLIDAHIPNLIVLAHLENNRLNNLYLDTDDRSDTVGNIYLGKVSNVMTSLSAYFIDYGAEKNGFLPFSSANTQLKRDDKVIVQVVKSPKDTKGARLTCFIKLVGQYSVLMPFGSQRKTDESQSFIKQSNGNYNLIQQDLNKLNAIWRNIETSAKKNNKPNILHQEYSLIRRILRDKYNTKPLQIYIDGYNQYMHLKETVEDMSLPHKVKEYKSIIPILAKYRALPDIKKLTNRTIPLESGGSIVIDITEAMVAIDINSGSCNAGDLEATSHRVNLEAAAEIARQIKLQDLSGIIAIDFIDMTSESNLISIESAMKNHMQDDKAMVRFSKINEFGVMMLSRQRSGINLHQQIYSKCNHCLSNGLIKNTQVLAFEIICEIRTSMYLFPNQPIQVECEERVQSYLLNELRGTLYALEKQGSSIKITINNDCLNKFIITPTGQLKEADLVSFQEEVVIKEAPRPVPRFMQELQLFKQQYISTSGYGGTITVDMGGI
jgi:ribonuclease E